jgi:thiol-disulfide isomerase/thioredoxin
MLKQTEQRAFAIIIIMNKKIIIITSIVAVVAVLSGLFAYESLQNDNELKTMSMEMQPVADSMNNEEATAMVNNDAMSNHGSYVTLSDYNSNPSKYADTNNVYFFHASWCPICQGIDKEISANESLVPAGVTLIKTDFDTSTDLRKKYGVTTQYTFVQVDSNGNEIAQWSATNTDKAIAGIKL